MTANNNNGRTGRQAGIGGAKKMRGPGDKSMQMLCESPEQMRQIQAEKIRLAIREERRNLPTTVKNMLRPLELSTELEQVKWLRSIGVEHGVAHRLITGFMLFSEEEGS